jgi:hypothetical protein
MSVFARISADTAISAQHMAQVLHPRTGALVPCDVCVPGQLHSCPTMTVMKSLLCLHQASSFEVW